MLLHGLTLPASLPRHSAGTGWDPGAFVDVLFVSRMRTAADRAEVASLYQRTFGAPPTVRHRAPLLPATVADGEHRAFALGGACWATSSEEGSAGAVVPSHRAGLPRALSRQAEHVLRCVHLRWPVLLAGGPSSGKTELLRGCAELCGADLRELALSSSADATELLGGFEQADTGRLRSGAASTLSRLMRAVSRQLQLVAAGVLSGPRGTSPHVTSAVPASESQPLKRTQPSEEEEDEGEGGAKSAGGNGRAAKRRRAAAAGSQTAAPASKRGRRESSKRARVEEEGTPAPGLVSAPGNGAAPEAEAHEACLRTSIRLVSLLRDVVRIASGESSGAGEEEQAAVDDALLREAGSVALRGIELIRDSHGRGDELTAAAGSVPPSEVEAWAREVRSELEAVESAAAGALQGRFEWVDGTLLQAVEAGAWLVLDNANFCSASVLDRLNSLLEPHGFLLVNESGSVVGQPRVVRPHPSFRLFFTMDPRHGEVSRALRNRCVELFASTPRVATSEAGDEEEEAASLEMDGADGTVVLRGANLLTPRSLSLGAGDDTPVDAADVLRKMLRAGVPGSYRLRLCTRCIVEGSGRRGCAHCACAHGNRMTRVIVARLASASTLYGRPALWGFMLHTL